MNVPIKVGIIGLGIGMLHLEACARNPRCQVTAVADFSSDKLAEARRKAPTITSCVTDASQLIHNSEVQLVVISSFEQFHARQIVDSLRAGKHVFCEKPFCVSPDEARSVRQAISASPHLRFSSNLILRRYPAFIELKHRVDSNELGPLFYLEGDYNYGRLEKIVSGWRGDEPEYSVMLGGGIHLVDALLWLSKKRVASVMTYGTKVVTKGSKFKGDDTVVALLKFADGTVGKIGANFGCVYPHTHRVMLYGTSATIEKSLPGMFIVRERGDNAPALPISFEETSCEKGAMLSSFVDAMVSGSPIEVGVEEIFMAISVCFAIDRSLKTGAPEVVEYL